MRFAHATKQRLSDAATHTCASSIHAGKMDVSGGYVTIAKSEASENGGSGEVGCFLGPGTGGRGMPPQEVACRASGALQFGAEDKA